MTNPLRPGVTLAVHAAQSKGGCQFMDAGKWKNQLHFGDSLDILRTYVPGQSVDVADLDPPFNSNRNYNAIFAHRDVVDATSAQIQAFEDTRQWTNVTEAQYTDFISGGAPSSVGQALIALRASDQRRLCGAPRSSITERSEEH